MKRVLERVLNKKIDYHIKEKIKLFILTGSHMNFSFEILPQYEKEFEISMKELSDIKFFEKNDLKVIICPTDKCTVVNIVRNRDLEEWQERHIL